MTYFQFNSYLLVIMKYTSKHSPHHSDSLQIGVHRVLHRVQLCLPAGHVLRVYPYICRANLNVSSPKWYLQFPFCAHEAMCRCTNNMSLFLLATFCTGDLGISYRRLCSTQAVKVTREKERGSTGKPLSGSETD